jgi:FlaA1/EpsC-like NDP-sugar epimerase
VTRIVGIGAGGHAKILMELVAQAGGYELIGFIDSDHVRWGTQFMGYPILGGDDQLPVQRVKGVEAAFIGVGAISCAGTRLRSRLYQEAVKLGYNVPALVHPRVRWSNMIR